MQTCASYVVVGIKMAITTPPVFLATTYQLSGGYFYKFPAVAPVSSQFKNFPYQKRGDAKGALTSLYIPVESENLKSGFQPGITSLLGEATFEGFGIVANFEFSPSGTLVNVPQMAAVVCTFYLRLNGSKY